MSKAINNNNLDLVVKTAQTLKQAGKTPNTAMLKAKLPKNISLPDIIAGLKQYQDNPKQKITLPENSLTTSEPAVTGSIDKLIEAQIKQAIAPLAAEIKALKAQIQQLTNNSDKVDS